MILIVGGRGQGKLAFARRLLDGGRPGAGDGFGPEWAADGAADPMEAAFSRPVVFNFHLYVRRILEAGESPEIFAGRLCQENPGVLVIADEIGCGVVPMGAFERRYRDAAGEVCQYLARESSEVYRVICGIGQKIK